MSPPAASPPAPGPRGLAPVVISAAPPSLQPRAGRRPRRPVRHRELEPIAARFAAASSPGIPTRASSMPSPPCPASTSRRAARGSSSASVPSPSTTSPRRVPSSPRTPNSATASSSRSAAAAGALPLLPRPPALPPPARPQPETLLRRVDLALPTRPRRPRRRRRLGLPWIDELVTQLATAAPTSPSPPSAPKASRPPFSKLSPIPARIPSPSLPKRAPRPPSPHRQRPPDAALIRAVQLGLDAGMSRFKLYFMVGLPGETLPSLGHRRARGHPSPRGAEGCVYRSLNPFVPKPHTSSPPNPCPGAHPEADPAERRAGTALCWRPRHHSGSVRWPPSRRCSARAAASSARAGPRLPGRRHRRASAAPSVS